MPFATWWRNDPLPDLSPLPTFSALRSTDRSLITSLTNLSEQTINARFQAGHYPYIAFVDKTPAAYGWVATQQGGISALHFSFTISPHNVYLWDFLTLTQWRGRGIYPHLLQSIVQQEPSTKRFWIGYEPGNEASARGIRKAGFHIVGDFVISHDHVSGLTLFDASEHALASPAFFNDLPVITDYPLA
jgi:RimJ/RimL family protein N-acetyltransferase